MRIISLLLTPKRDWFGTHTILKVIRWSSGVSFRTPLANEYTFRRRFMISEVTDKVKEFLKETVDAKGIRIIRIDPIGQDWIAEAEVAEKNQYLASIKPEYHVFEKERYLIKLNADLEVSSYKRLKGSEETQENAIYGF